MDNKRYRSVVVTGATAGIGFQTALDFAVSGDFVIGVGRNQQRCAEAKNKILSIHPGARVEFVIADLSSQQQVRSLANQINYIMDENHFSALDVLVNNAGLYMGKKEMTGDHIETTFAVNHLAPFLLTHLLLPRMEQSPTSRVITVSSESHYHTHLIPERAANPRIFFGLTAYKVSKLANILFSLELNRLLIGRSPRAFAVDPGLVNTEIGMKETGGLAKLVWRSRKHLGVSPEVPAATILFLANHDEVLHSNEIYWHESKPKSPSRNALDPKLASRLWIESCRLCGILENFEGERP